MSDSAIKRPLRFHSNSDIISLRRALTSENSLLIKYDHHIDLLSDSSCCSDPVCTLQSAVRAVEADADLRSLGSEQDCVLPSRDSSFPEKPALPYDEPACVWWRIQRFPPAETKPRAPVWERDETSFTSTSNYRPTRRPPLVFLVVSVILFLQSQNAETKRDQMRKQGGVILKYDQNIYQTEGNRKGLCLI